MSESRHPHMISDDEIARLIDMAESPRDKAFVSSLVRVARSVEEHINDDRRRTAWGLGAVSCISIAAALAVWIFVNKVNDLSAVMGALETMRTDVANLRWESQRDIALLRSRQDDVRAWIQREDSVRNGVRR